MFNNNMTIQNCMHVRDYTLAPAAADGIDEAFVADANAIVTE